MFTPLQQLSRIVIETAERELPARFNCRRGTRKTNGSLVTEADLVMQQHLCAALREQWPDTTVLGEEMSQSDQQATLESPSSGIWCVDPLDGTSNFAAGIPYYAVSVALVKDGTPDIAVVYDPSRGECFAAAHGRGAWLNGTRLQKGPADTTLAEAVALIDLKRLPTTLAERLAGAPPYKSQRNFGAVALDWCWLAAGRGHVYLHGRQKLWDYAAGCLILHETGGRSTTLDGEKVFMPALTPRSSAAALHEDIFDQWGAWLGIAVG